MKNGIKELRKEAKRLAKKGIYYKNAAKRTRDPQRKKELQTLFEKFLDKREELLLYIRTGKPTNFVYQAPDEPAKTKAATKEKPQKTKAATQDEPQKVNANTGPITFFKTIILKTKNIWKKIKQYLRNWMK